MAFPWRGGGLAYGKVVHKGTIRGVVARELVRVKDELCWYKSAQFWQFAATAAAYGQEVDFDLRVDHVGRLQWRQPITSSAQFVCHIYTEFMARSHLSYIFIYVHNIIYVHILYVHNIYAISSRPLFTANTLAAHITIIYECLHSRPYIFWRKTCAENLNNPNPPTNGLGGNVIQIHVVRINVTPYYYNDTLIQRIIYRRTLLYSWKQSIKR